MWARVVAANLVSVSEGLEVRLHRIKLIWNLGFH